MATGASPFRYDPFVSTQHQRMIIASIVAALLSGAIYLLTPWRESSIDPPLAGFALLYANGLKYATASIFWLAVAVGAGTWIQSWIDD